MVVVVMVMMVMMMMMMMMLVMLVMLLMVMMMTMLVMLLILLLVMLMMMTKMKMMLGIMIHLRKLLMIDGRGMARMPHLQASNKASCALRAHPCHKRPRPNTGGIHH